MQEKGADEEKEGKTMESREGRNPTGGKEVEEREQWETETYKVPAQHEEEL